MARRFIALRAVREKGERVEAKKKRGEKNRVLPFAASCSVKGGTPRSNQSLKYGEGKGLLPFDCLLCSLEKQKTYPCYAERAGLDQGKKGCAYHSITCLVGGEEEKGKSLFFTWKKEGGWSGGRKANQLCPLPRVGKEGERLLFTCHKENKGPASSYT